MSCNYAEGLSPYPDKGQLGMPERFAEKEEVSLKVAELAALMKASRHTVFHTGAGISTSAGIPDFRGPKGVWTLEKKGLKPDVNVSFDDALPTFTHMALVALEKAGLIQYLVTQNIDGLHLRSGFPRRKMAELHGNMYLDKCSVCKREFVRHTAVSTVGQKTSGVGCTGKRDTGRRCRGRLHDNILDWEHDLPHLDYNLAEKHSTASDLSVCLGTTLQIIPSGVLPTIAKQSGGKLVICNLQPTKHDKISDLIINCYVDDLMRELLSLLNVRCAEYSLEQDPVLITRALRAELKDAADPIEWTIPDEWFDDRDLIEKVRRNKQIASANNSNKRTPRARKVDRRKRRSLIKEEPPSAATTAGSTVQEDEDNGGKDALSPPAQPVKEMSERNRRYNRGRKRQSEDVESAGEQPLDDKVKLQRLDDCKNETVDSGKDEEMQVDERDESTNASPTDEEEKELKPEADQSNVAKGHVLLENLSKDAVSSVDSQLECSSRIKDENKVTGKGEDSNCVSFSLEPNKESSINGSASSSAKESSKNSLCSENNTTSSTAISVKAVASTQLDSSVACDEVSVRKDSEDHTKRPNYSSTENINLTTSSLTHLRTNQVSSSELAERNPGNYTPQPNGTNDTAVVKSSPEEPAFKKQKLSEALPEIKQSSGESVGSCSTTSVKVLNRTELSSISSSTPGTIPNTTVLPINSSMKDEEPQQTEHDNKLFESSHSINCKPTVDQTIVRSSISVAKNTQSPSLLKSSMDGKESSESETTIPVLPDSSSKAGSIENLAAVKSKELSPETKASDVSSTKTDGSEEVYKAKTNIQPPPTRIATASEGTGASDSGTTSTESESDVTGSKANGSSKNDVETPGKGEALNDCLMKEATKTDSTKTEDESSAGKNTLLTLQTTPIEIGGQVSWGSVEEKLVGPKKSTNEDATAEGSKEEPKNVTASKTTGLMFSDESSNITEAPKITTQESKETDAKRDSY